MSLVFFYFKLGDKGLSQVLLRITLTVKVEGHLINQVCTVVRVALRIPLGMSLEMAHELDELFAVNSYLVVREQ